MRRCAGLGSVQVTGCCSALARDSSLGARDVSDHMMTHKVALTIIFTILVILVIIIIITSGAREHKLPLARDRSESVSRVKVAREKGRE